MGIGLDFGFTSVVDVYDIGSSTTYTFEEDSPSSTLGTLVGSKVSAAIVYENGLPRVFVDQMSGAVLSPRGQYRLVSKFDTYMSSTVSQIIDEDAIIGYDIKCS